MESVLRQHRHSLLLPSTHYTPLSCHSLACLQSCGFCDGPRLTSLSPTMHPYGLHLRFPSPRRCKSLRAQLGSSPASHSSAKQQLLTALTGVLTIETASEFGWALHPGHNSLMSTGIKQQSMPRALPATAVSSPLFEAWRGQDNLYQDQDLIRSSFKLHLITFRRRGQWVCFGGGKRPRKPHIWKTKQRRGTVSKSEKLVQHVEGLSNVKEEVYGALDTFIAWDLEFPLITVKKALKTFQLRKDWKRILQISKWMLSKGQGRTLGTYSLLLEALNEEGRLEEAEELWQKIFNENLQCVPRTLFSYVISMYERHGMYEKLLEVFADMEELGINPHMSIVQRVARTYEKLGMLDRTEKVWKKYPPPTVVENGQSKGRFIEVPNKTPQNGVNKYVRLEGNTDDMDSADSNKDAMFNCNDNEHFSDIDDFSEEPIEEKVNSLEQCQQEDNAIVPARK